MPKLIENGDIKFGGYTGDDGPMVVKIGRDSDQPYAPLNWEAIRANIDDVTTDAIMHGVGYYEVTSDGIRHVPHDEAIARLDA